MMVVDSGGDFLSVLGTQMVPGGGLDVLAAVFFPFAVGFVTEDAGSLLLHIANRHPGADVETDAVIEIGVPADGLLF